MLSYQSTIYSFWEESVSCHIYNQFKLNPMWCHMYKCFYQSLFSSLVRILSWLMAPPSFSAAFSQNLSAGSHVLQERCQHLEHPEEMHRHGENRWRSIVTPTPDLCSCLETLMLLTQLLFGPEQNNQRSSYFWTGFHLLQMSAGWTMNLKKLILFFC